MNEALNSQSSDAFDTSSVATLRRVRGNTPASNDDSCADLSVEVHQRARAARSSAIRGLIAAFLSQASESFRRARARHREYRDARETVQALRGLDDRTLHDLGYDRSEIESVALEIAVSRAR